MSNRVGRLATIEDHLGVNAGPCRVCGHKAGSVRCERPEDVAETNRQFDEAMKTHMAMTERMRWKLDELGVDWE